MGKKYKREMEGAQDEKGDDTEKEKKEYEDWEKRKWGG